ncbi:MAG: MarR family winged helix-turn-helix transcriptional regulator [Nannocystales bacterium]
MSDAHRLLERISALFRAQLRRVSTDHGLKLVQLEALVYLNSANRYSDTPLALAEYLALTKGTVSQTLKTLESSALIAKTPDPEDRRVQHCAVTSEGAEIVADALRIPSAPDPELESALRSVLRSLQHSADARTFGVCNSCTHHQVDAGRARCGLTGETLRKADRVKICREHEPVQLRT